MKFLAITVCLAFCAHLVVAIPANTGFHSNADIAPQNKAVDNVSMKAVTPKKHHHDDDDDDEDDEDKDDDDKKELTEEEEEEEEKKRLSEEELEEKARIDALLAEEEKEALEKEREEELTEIANRKHAKAKGVKSEVRNN